MDQRDWAIGNVMIGISAAAMAAALFLVFLVAPREAVMGDVQRIFYFHVSASWVGYLALLVTLIASLVFLRRRAYDWDALAFSSAEIGLVFISVGILTGSIWAKATWGVWWTWDPRLTTSAVLWLTYAAYLILRQAIEERERRARATAIYSIVGFVSVPLNFMAIRWWRAAHPVVLGSSGLGLAPAMLATMLFCVGTFTLFYVALLCVRLRLEKLCTSIREFGRQ